MNLCLLHTAKTYSKLLLIWEYWCHINQARTHTYTHTHTHTHTHTEKKSWHLAPRPGIHNAKKRWWKVVICLILSQGCSRRVDKSVLGICSLYWSVSMNQTLYPYWLHVCSSVADLWPPWGGAKQKQLFSLFSLDAGVGPSWECVLTFFDTWKVGLVNFQLCHHCPSSVTASWWYRRPPDTRKKGIWGELFFWLNEMGLKGKVHTRRKETSKLTLRDIWWTLVSLS